MKKKALVALVLAVIAAAILVPTVVLAAPSSQGAPPATADQTARAKPWVGVAVVPLNDRLAERLGLVGKTGLVVLHVAPEGPAAKAGLKPRDLITTVNGQPVGTVQSLQEAIKTAGLGGSITLGVFRDGVDLAPMTVALAERPGRPKPEAHALPGIKPHGKLHQGSATFEDRDGKSSPSASLPATVSAKGDGSLTLKSNGGGEQTVAIAGEVKLVKGHKEVTLDQVEIGDNAVVISRDGQIQRVQIGGPRPFHGFHAGGRGVFPGPLPQVRERLEDLPALTPEARDQLKKRLDGARIKIDKSKIKKDAGDRAPGRQRPAPQRAPAVAGPATGVDL